jgi:hypothetical protein
MTSMTRLQALPLAFCHEERGWYRGLTALDQTVVPVVKPDGFLTPDELFLLDAALSQEADAEAIRIAEENAQDAQDSSFTQ